MRSPSEPKVPMDAAELQAIGERLYGPWGWPVKIGRAIDRDASTIRRWRAGGSIDYASATTIRNLALDASVEDWPREVAARVPTDAERALRLIADVQALSASGVPGAIGVDDIEGAIRLTLWFRGVPSLVAVAKKDGMFDGLDRLEQAVRERSPGE